MAPIKQEEQMKDKLEKRSLQPSPEGWSTLANRLDAEQKKKNSSLFWWLGIAASIVGIVFMTALYFNGNSGENSIPTVVDTQDNVMQQKNQEKIEMPTANEKVAVEEVVPTKNILSETKPKSLRNTSSSDKNQITNKLPQEEAIAQIEQTPSEETSEKVPELKKATLTFEEQKIQEVVAQINDLKSNGNLVSDVEIDNLLKKAQKEILSNRLNNETTRMVDANALLQDVEEDLQQSFRSKVFKALQSGYESVKTAVAERNH